MRSPLLRTQRPRPGRWVTAVAAALILTAAGLAINSPAQAVPLPLTDDFETNPGSRWTAFEVAGITDVTLGSIAGVRPRGGANLAYLNAYPDAPAAATIARTVVLDTVPNADLQVQVWVRRVSHQNESPNHSVLSILRIRDGGPFGQVLSNKGVTIHTTGSWSLVTFAPFRALRTFTVEIGAWMGTLVVDDLRITT